MDWGLVPLWRRSRVQEVERPTTLSHFESYCNAPITRNARYRRRGHGRKRSRRGPSFGGGLTLSLAINTNLLCFTSRFVFLDRHHPASYTQAQQYSINSHFSKIITPDPPACPCHPNRVNPRLGIARVRPAPQAGLTIAQAPPQRQRLRSNPFTATSAASFTTSLVHRQ